MVSGWAYSINGYWASMNILGWLSSFINCISGGLIHPSLPARQDQIVVQVRICDKCGLSNAGDVSERPWTIGTALCEAGTLVKSPSGW